MDKFKFCFIIVSLTFVCFCILETNCSDQSKLLYDKLLQNYNKLVRPVQNESQELKVELGLTLMQIVELDEQSHTLTALIWITLRWTDYYLKWNKTDYANITTLRFPVDQIWYPDIYAYNSASEEIDPLHHGTKAVVNSTGFINYIPPGIFSTTCSLDHTNYPWDEQKCEIKFGSWTHDGKELNLVVHSEDGGDISSFLPNPEWALVGTGIPVKRTVKTYACCEEPYIDITYTINIQRRGDLIYAKLRAWNLVIWTTVLLGFLHPSSSPLKICFPAGGLLLSFWIISSLSFLAHTAKYPWAYYYFLVQLWINLFAVGANVLACFFHNKTGQCYGWLIELTNSKFLSVLCPTRKNQRSTRLGSVASDSEQMDESRTFDMSNSDWKYFASILDRTFTIIFTIVIIIVNITLFP